jgi:hypothetical protein
VEWQYVGDFERAIPDEAAAVRWLEQRKWPKGVRCGDCGSARVTRISTRPNWWSCKDCPHHTSLRSGTPLHGTRKPIRDWIYAMWRCNLMSPIPARRLQAERGYGSYETAWSMLHKVRAALSEWQVPLDNERVWLGFRWFAVARRARGESKLVPVLAAIASDRSPIPQGRPFGIVRPVADPGLRAADVADEAAAAVALDRETVYREWSEAGTGGESRHCRDAIDGVAEAFEAFLSAFGGISRRYFANYLAQFLVATGVAYPRIRFEPFASRVLDQWRPADDLRTGGQEWL